MELYEAIKERRSIRKYKGDPIPEEVMDRLLEAAQWAPSWAHTQSPEIVLVSDPAQKALIQECLPSTNPAFRAMVDAPVVAVFIAKKGKAGYYGGKSVSKHGDWMMFDAALAMQNFLLAAHAEGLATVCVGLFEVDVANEVLGLPEDMETIAITPVGYSDKVANVPPRKPRAKFVHKDRYSA